MFDPSIGRWTSEDPIGFDAGDPDLTRYCENDPTNATDPSGLVIALQRRPGTTKDAGDRGLVRISYTTPQSAHEFGYGTSLNGLPCNFKITVRKADYYGFKNKKLNANGIYIDVSGEGAEWVSFYQFFSVRFKVKRNGASDPTEKGFYYLPLKWYLTPRDNPGQKVKAETGKWYVDALIDGGGRGGRKRYVESGYPGVIGKTDSWMFDSPNLCAYGAWDWWFTGPKLDGVGALKDDPQVESVTCTMDYETYIVLGNRAIYRINWQTQSTINRADGLDRDAGTDQIKVNLFIGQKESRTEFQTSADFITQQKLVGAGGGGGMD